VENNEFHGLFDRLKQGVGNMAIINDHCRRFETADENMVP